MPGLTFIKIIGNLKFLSHGKKLPVNWQAPSGDPGAKHYSDALAPADKIAIPQLIPPWFLPQEMNKYFQDSCDKVGNFFKDLHDTMLDAIGFGHNLWKLQAKFQNLIVMGPCAMGTPGCLSGPDLEGSIKKYPPIMAWTGNKAKWRDAIAKGVSQCFQKWQDQVTVPGLPWYPAFAAFPSAMAPPMPNLPMPLITCPSPMMTQIIMPDAMKQAMEDALDSSIKDEDKDRHRDALFDAVATVLALAFLIWLPSQQVNLVLGKGPIPVFAPPFVPVGPVVGGDNIAAPGHLMA